MPYDARQSQQASSRQVTLTVLAEVGDEAALRAALGAFDAAAFSRPAFGIHFARLLLVPRDRDGVESSSWLALETNFDTAEADDDPARARQLATLADAEGSALTAVFRHCVGFPGPGGLGGYLSSHQAPPTAAYQGHPHHDLGRIGLERRVRAVVLELFEQTPRASQADLFERARNHVRALSKTDPALAGLDVDAPPPSLPDPAVRSKHLRQNITPWVVNIQPALPILFKHLGQVNEWDKSDAFYDIRTRQEAWTDEDRARFVEIAASEDHGMQNALSHVVPLRVGRAGPDSDARLDVLRSAHAFIAKVAANHFSYVGELGGIPTIHFAKWLLIDGDRRLLFFSNYDSSWESYLGDFVDKAAAGLNLAWSCTREYPKTRLLAGQGAHDEEAFKSWGRACQVPTQVFYSAYPDLSIQAINSNTWIRYRLHQAAGEGSLDAWFRRLT